MRRLIQAVCWILFLCAQGFAQEFTRVSSATVPPQQVMPDQFTVVRLPVTLTDDPKSNRFDNGNPYTYLEFIQDRRGRTHQLLYQTGFTGNMLFLAYSNSLSPVFGRKDKPMFMFQSCIRGIRDVFSSSGVIEKLIQCVVDRLNYCAET